MNCWLYYGSFFVAQVVVHLFKRDAMGRIYVHLRSPFFPFMWPFPTVCCRVRGIHQKCRGLSIMTWFLERWIFRSETRVTRMFLQICTVVRRQYIRYRILAEGSESLGKDRRYSVRWLYHCIRLLTVWNRLTCRWFEMCLTLPCVVTCYTPCMPSYLDDETERACNRLTLIVRLLL